MTRKECDRRIKLCIDRQYREGGQSQVNFVFGPRGSTVSVEAWDVELPDGEEAVIVCTQSGFWAILPDGSYTRADPGTAVN